jgi:polar amino acid transport system substrate-binding protein
VVAGAALLTAPAASCENVRDTASDDLTTATDGVLTVAASLPSPGFWELDDAGAASGGFEWAIADALATRFDLRLEVVDVAFDRIARGDFGGADLALAQIEITSDRQTVMDFGVPYLASDMGVLVRVGDTVRDLATARDLSWATVSSTREEEFVRDTIDPGTALQLADDETAAAALVAVEHVDAALIDLPSALVIAADQPALDVAARFVTGGQYAVALPTDSPNRELIDAALRSLANDGSLDRFERDWLVPAFSRPPGDVPVIQSR